MNINVYTDTNYAVLPTKGTDQSACFDIYADLRGSGAMYGVKTYAHRDDAAAMYYRVPHPVIVHTTHDNQLRIGVNERALVPTGLVFDIPEGYCIKMYPRSSAAFKRGLALVNSTGIIDSDYTEPIFIPIINVSGDVQWISHGERLAQIEVCPVTPITITETSDKPGQKTDRIGGIGSTGL